jgi:hypothetical protein
MSRCAAIKAQEIHPTFNMQPLLAIKISPQSTKLYPALAGI